MATDMKLSIYTIARDCIYFDFHLEAMLRHHLTLADEIVVVEGFSQDETYERIADLSPKVRIFREKWEIGTSAGSLYSTYKDHARQRCTGDWCVLLDSDEFIPEWEFDRLRDTLPKMSKSIAAMSYINFYGNYRIYSINPERYRWPAVKYPIHRNDPNIRVWGDGSNVEHLLDGDDAIEKTPLVNAHHMGFVRHPARLRHKWRIQQKLNLDTPRHDRTPGLLFDLAPHDWFDKDFLDDLRVYDGPFIGAVRDDPAEFVRDDLKLYDFVKRRESERLAELRRDK